MDTKTLVADLAAALAWPIMYLVTLLLLKRQIGHLLARASEVFLKWGDKEGRVTLGERVAEAVKIEAPGPPDEEGKPAAVTEELDGNREPASAGTGTAQTPSAQSGKKDGGDQPVSAPCWALDREKYLADARERYRLFSRIEPRATMAEAWARLEIALRGWETRTAMKERRTATRKSLLIARRLRRDGRLTEEQYQLFVSLRRRYLRLQEEAVRPTSDEASQYAILASMLCFDLRVLIAKIPRTLIERPEAENGMNITVRGW